MTNGYSSSKQMAEMGNHFHLDIAAFEIDCWTESVNSDTNIAVFLLTYRQDQSTSAEWAIFPPRHRSARDRLLDRMREQRRQHC